MYRRITNDWERNRNYFLFWVTFEVQPALQAKLDYFWSNGVRRVLSVLVPYTMNAMTAWMKKKKKKRFTLNLGVLPNIHWWLWSSSLSLVIPGNQLSSGRIIWNPLCWQATSIPPSWPSKEVRRNSQPKDSCKDSTSTDGSTARTFFTGTRTLWVARVSTPVYPQKKSQNIWLHTWYEFEQS